MVLTGEKILDSRLSESPKNEFSRTFYKPKLSLESEILHCLRQNFPEYPRDITAHFMVLKITHSIDSQTGSWRLLCLYQNNSCNLTWIYCSR